MGNYGIKIAKEGYSPEDGNNRLIFHSSYPLLKISSSGSGTITLSSGEASKTLYTHNLGFKPMFYVWVNYIDVQTGTEIEKLRMCSWRDYAGLGACSNYNAYVTTTTLELVIDSAYSINNPEGPGNETLDYRYVIYYDGIS